MQSTVFYINLKTCMEGTFKNAIKKNELKKQSNKRKNKKDTIRHVGFSLKTQNLTITFVFNVTI